MSFHRARPRHFEHLVGKMVRPYDIWIGNIEREYVGMNDRGKHVCWNKEKTKLIEWNFIDESKYHEFVGTLAEIEEDAIKELLRRYDWRKSDVARHLGVGLKTIYRKIEEYKIKKEVSE